MCPLFGVGENRSLGSGVSVLKEFLLYIFLKNICLILSTEELFFLLFLKAHPKSFQKSLSFIGKYRKLHSRVFPGDGCVCFWMSVVVSVLAH